MESGLINIRQHLIDHIASKLAGWNRELEVWTRDFVAREPGQRMIINNQVIDRPGAEHKGQFKCELWGQGELVGEGIIFEIINCEVWIDDDKHSYINTNIYYDELETIDQIFNQIFRL